MAPAQGWTACDCTWPFPRPRLPLLLLLPPLAALLPAHSARDVRGKSIYFVTVDRFARTDGNDTECEGDFWCGGKIRGVTEHLEYIQAMGFEGVWITPVIGQRDKEPVPPGVSMGYHAWYWDKIDEHFGTEDDLKNLSRELHRRGMVFVYDIVMNHVGPINSSSDVHEVQPFNETFHYHTRNISALPDPCTKSFCEDHNDTCTERYCREARFDEYAGTPPGSWVMSPLQGGMGPCGFSCTKEGCEYPHTASMCENYDCKPGVPGGCEYKGDNAAGPAELLRCGVGDWVCPGYEHFDHTYVTDGWDINLGDLNHSHPFVRKYLKDWAKRMADTYDIDMFRLDTAYWVDKDFLQELQAEVPIPIIAEVNPTPNMTFHSSYQSDPTMGRVVDGLLNFPIMFVATAAFCPSLGKFNFYPFANLNLTRLGGDMREQLQSGLYKDELMLGNFVDNHDYARIGSVCGSDRSRVFNALAWVMLYKGIPIIYEGTEQDMDFPGGGFNGEDRTSLWQYKWRRSTDTFKFLAELNKIRNRTNISLADAEVAHFEETQLVFSRGGPYGVWVFLNNFPNTTEQVEYNFVPPTPPMGQRWVSALSGLAATFSGGRHVVRHSRPEVLVLETAPRETSIKFLALAAAAGFVLGCAGMALVCLGRASSARSSTAYTELQDTRRGGTP
mmetsp:Transcript_93203/g.268318  ORF Transcript_93203/g.268318 Transcript_93203/m.268318 type:complete len:670 (-) Transcript_93203:116-2125(-)